MLDPANLATWRETAVNVLHCDVNTESNNKHPAIDRFATTSRELHKVPAACCQSIAALKGVGSHHGNTVGGGRTFRTVPGGDGGAGGPGISTALSRLLNEWRMQPLTPSCVHAVEFMY